MSESPCVVARTMTGPEAWGKALPARIRENEAEPAAPVVLDNIPWSYEVDRVTAMVVDPDTLYVYWEVTDPSVEATRRRLGEAGESAWLNLRIYDTSGRLFDGTNAHSYFDQGLDRADRQWFFLVGKPSSTAVAEIGLMSREGYFVAIARSGRAEFPRKEPLPCVSQEWMTVRAETGEVVGSGSIEPEKAASGAEGPGGFPATGAASVSDPVSRHHWIPLREFHESHRSWVYEGASFEEFFSTAFRTSFRSIEWLGGVVSESWEAGPFPYPVEVLAPVREEFEGPTVVSQVDGETRVVFGPWKVVIRGLGARRERLLVARWEVHRQWAVGDVREVSGGVHGRRMGSSDGWLGASERRFIGASELRFGGASELYFIGASERWLGGASETRFVGASEWSMRGASERRFAGASEWRLAGASEVRLGGASERAFAGASERWQIGGSEHRLGGASEGRALRGPGATPPATAFPPAMPFPDTEPTT